MKVHEIREALAARTREMRSIVEAANGADLSDQQRARFDTLETECRNLTEKLTRETRIAELERQAAATPINGGTGDRDFDRECRAPGLFLDAIAAAGNIEGRDTGRVREISRELARRMGVTPQGIMLPTSVFERRVVVSSTTGAGAIPTDHRSDLTVDALRAATVVDRLGATVLSNLTGNVSIPAIDTGFTAQWIAENGAITPADWDINARTLSPKHVGAITEFSLNMIKQADPSVDAMASRDGARALAAALDSASLVGGGSNQPSGIIARLTTFAQMGTWATPSWAEGLALMSGPEIDNVVAGAAGWALHPSVRKKLMSTLVAASTDSRMIMSDPNTLYGQPAYVSGHASLLGSPSGGTAIYSPAWENLVVGYWGGVDILANPYESTAYTKGNVQVRALLTADVVVRNTEAFAAAADMATA
jgi:HK97 family phage major capsid protein